MEMDPAGTDPAIRGVRPLLLFPHAPVFESPCQARLLDRIPWPHEGASPSRLPSLVIHSSSGKKRVPPPPRSVPDLRPSTADSPIPCFSAQADSEAELPNRFPPGKPHIEVTDLNPDRSPPTPVWIPMWTPVAGLEPVETSQFFRRGVLGLKAGGDAGGETHSHDSRINFSSQSQRDGSRSWAGRNMGGGQGQVKVWKEKNRGRRWVPSAPGARGGTLVKGTDTRKATSGLLENPGSRDMNPVGDPAGPSRDPDPLLV